MEKSKIRRIFSLIQIWIQIQLSYWNAHFHHSSQSAVSLTEVNQMAILATFLGPAFAASRVQHISDLHSNFALNTPCVEVW